MKPYRVLAVQTDPAFGEVEENLERALAQTARALSRAPADLVVLPELFATGYAFVSQREALDLAEPVRTGPTARRLLEFAGDFRVHVVAGFCERHGRRAFNSAVVLAPGRRLGTYRKVHLFDEEKRWFAAGTQPWPVFRMGRARVGVLICFDWRFPEAARSLALAGADILAHPSNLVLPHCQSAMVTRALENRVHCVTANRVGADRRPGKTIRFTGGSQIVTAGGEVVARASRDRPAVMGGRLDLAAARDKRINRRNDLLRDRVPGLYRRLQRR